MTHLRTTRFNRHGMTLIELLVVVGILSIMMGIAAVAVRIGTQGKKQREAARQVNAFIAGAQARAFELGRPCGFEIVRHGATLNPANTDAPLLNNVSFRMYMLESPPVYAGDTVDARISMQFNSTTRVVTLTDTAGVAALSMALFNSTDVGTGNSVGEVRIGYGGPQYSFQLLSIDPPPPVGSGLTMTFQVPQSDRYIESFFYRNPGGVVPVPFQLYLRPTRSSVTPLQLPSDMCIDLAFSGLGAADRQFHDSTAFGGGSSVKVMFSPTGAVDRIYDNNAIAVRPIGNVHLLVGKFNQALNLIGVDTSPSSLFDALTTLGETPSNITDPTSMWVSVNHLTGQVTTTRNGSVYLDEVTAQSWDDPQITSQARRFAQRVLTIKGQGDE